MEYEQDQPTYSIFTTDSDGVKSYYLQERHVGELIGIMNAIHALLDHINQEKEKPTLTKPKG